MKNHKKDKFNFIQDLIKHIEHGISDEVPLYVTHGYCTDGGTAGVMIHYDQPEAKIIPLDYDILSNPIARPLLADIVWSGIVDLEPFNTRTIPWYVDHHLSTIGKKINAEKIRFDANGDSGAWQLFLSNFLNPLPEHIVELAVMTRTTDTAGYTTDPPVTILKDLTDLDLTILDSTEGRKQNEQRIWTLDDAWGTVVSLKDHLNLHHLLAVDGFYGLTKFLPRINKRREFRKEGIKIADDMEISFDVIIFSFQEDTIDKFSIDRRLQKRGAKVTISMSKTPVGIKLSLRRNRYLSDEMNKKIQLNLLAEQMNGGGHAGASGAFVNDADEGMEIIRNWLKEKELTYSFIEIN